MKGSDTGRNVTIKQIELAGESPRRALPWVQELDQAAPPKWSLVEHRPA
jgi:hypothetical protein